MFSSSKMLKNCIDGGLWFKFPLLMYFRIQLEQNLGIEQKLPLKPTPVSVDSNTDLKQLKESTANKLKDLNEEKRKSARRKEYVNLILSWLISPKYSLLMGTKLVSEKQSSKICS